MSSSARASARQLRRCKGAVPRSLPRSLDAAGGVRILLSPLPLLELTKYPRRERQHPIALRPGNPPTMRSTCRRVSVLSSADRAMSFIRLPLTLGNTSAFPSSSDRAALRISSARPHSGTRCSRFALVRCDRDGPHVVVRVDLGPPCTTHLAGPRRGEHQKLERELDAERRAGCPHRRDQRRYVPMLDAATPACAGRDPAAARAPGRSGCTGCRRGSSRRRPTP